MGLGAWGPPHPPSACCAPALRPGGGLAQAHADRPDPSLLGHGWGPRAALSGVARGMCPYPLEEKGGGGDLHRSTGRGRASAGAERGGGDPRAT